jgi:hypothetical protein
MRLTKWFFAGAILAALVTLTGCANAPMKPIPPQIAALAPSAFVVLADGAVGVAVSKGVKPADIATIAYQLQQFASGSSITVQALTAEIQKLEAQANLNTAQTAAIVELRAAFDAIIAGYINNGVLSAAAKTTINEILQDLIVAAEMLGAPAPGPVPASPTADSVTLTNVTADSVGPPAPSSSSSPAMATLESPQVVGGATTTVIVAALKAFGHVNVSSPVAASIAVMATFLAGWLANH